MKLVVSKAALFSLFLILEQGCILIPAPFGMPVYTHRQDERWVKQRFSWRQRECADSISFYVRNESPGQEDYVQTYYLTDKDDVIAESWRHVPSGRFGGQAAIGPWSFSIHRKYLNPDTVRRIFEKQVYHPIDSMALVLPISIDGLYRILSWHIWAGKTEWYFWVYNGWLMTTEEYNRRREEYIRWFKTSISHQQRN